jgi:hypothetical protein
VIAFASKDAFRLIVTSRCRGRFVVDVVACADADAGGPFEPPPPRHHDMPPTSGEESYGKPYFKYLLMTVHEKQTINRRCDRDGGDWQYCSHEPRRE